MGRSHHPSGLLAAIALVGLGGIMQGVCVRCAWSRHLGDRKNSTLGCVFFVFLLEVLMQCWALLCSAKSFFVVALCLCTRWRRKKMLDLACDKSEGAGTVLGRGRNAGYMTSGTRVTEKEKEREMNATKRGGT